MCEADGRLCSPSFERNFAPIRDALRAYLDGRDGTVLEIGSGTGQHIAHWAGEFPDLTWVPSDIDPQHHASIAAWGRPWIAPIWRSRCFSTPPPIGPANRRCRHRGR